MKRLLYSLAFVILAACVPVLNGHDQPPKKVEREKADPKKVKDLMRRKLDNAQQILEAIALNDLNKTAKHASNLVQISKEAEWKVFNTPMYEMFSSDFRSNAEKMVKQAKDKNLDGVKLTYLEITLTCFHCHKYVRDQAQTQLDSDESTRYARWSVDRAAASQR